MGMTTLRAVTFSYDNKFTIVGVKSGLCKACRGLVLGYQPPQTGILTSKFRELHNLSFSETK